MLDDAQLQQDPTIAKALALDYMTLDDLKSGRGLALVLQHHAELGSGRSAREGPRDPCRDLEAE